MPLSTSSSSNSNLEIQVGQWLYQYTNQAAIKYFDNFQDTVLMRSASTLSLRRRLIRTVGHTTQDAVVARLIFVAGHCVI